MEFRKVLIFFLILIQCNSSLSRDLNPDPIIFEFHHRESLSISDTDDNVQDEEYDYDDPIGENDPAEQGDRHVRKRRNAKWSPDYDLYEQWAEEYYAQSEEPEKTSAPLKGDLLDRLINKAQNKTEEELEYERKADVQRKEILKSTLKYGTWVFGVVISFCFVVTIIKRCVKKFACDFCDAFSFKDKIQQLVNNFVPGVYVHKNGKKEYYKPTAEELDALKDIQKILFSAV